jgi:hypothetical protein
MPIGGSDQRTRGWRERPASSSLPRWAAAMWAAAMRVAGRCVAAMLIRREILERIVAGEVDLQFRRWTRATVRTGGTLRTSAGMLEIISVDRTTVARLTADEAHRAGYRTRRELLEHMRTTGTGDIHRIELRPGGPDPLIALRDRDDLSGEDVAGIRERLHRLDAHGPDAPWTERYLDLIADHPEVRAQDLADSLGLDKRTFKTRVRKLKALGLTISHSPGYELSPRGHAYRVWRDHRTPNA